MARPLLASFVAATLTLATSAVLAAGFNTDAEGWTASNGGAPVWMASGGNGGGWLQVTDITDDDFLLNAPVAWLGNWSAFAGSTLSFDARNINGDTPDWAPFGEVTITGTGGSLVFDMAAAGAPPADGQWHHYSFVLPASPVLANVTSLTIKGEFHAGVTEVVGFDNIQVTAVPEPSEAALLLGGLGLLGWLRRRR